MSKINPKPVTASNPDDKVVDTTRNITDLLPAVNQTDLLDKFINNTVGHAFQPEKSENISGFIGRTVSYYDPQTEFYLPESSHERSIYQLAPLVVTDNNGTIDHAIYYQDLLNLIRLQGGNDLDHSRLFQENYYSWAPPINLDKFVNYQNYLWLPDSGSNDAIVENLIYSDNFESGDPVGWTLTSGSAAPVEAASGDFSSFLGRFAGSAGGLQAVHKTYSLNPLISSVDVSFNFLKIDSWDTGSVDLGSGSNEHLNVYLNDELAFSITPPSVANVTHTFQTSTLNGTYELSSPMTSDQQLGFNQSYTDRIYRINIAATGVSGSIKLGFGSTTNQSINDESLGIDNILVTQIVDSTNLSTQEQDYIVMERGAVDGNPWSTNNKWFHIDDLTSDQTDTAKNFRARRPIIEFNKDLELFNYGKVRINPINLLNSSLINPASINGQVNYVLDGVTLANGMRVIFTNPNIPSDFGWENTSWEGETATVGIWDDSISQTLAANTLTFSNTSSHGIIDGGVDFDSTFSIGQRIKISGSSSDGYYFVRNVSATSLYVDPQFANIGNQTGEVTIEVAPSYFMNKIFKVTGVGDSIKLIETEYGENTSVVTIKASGTGEYSGISFDKTFTVTKSFEGQNGTLAKIISIAPSDQIVSYDSDNNPVSKTITVNATRLNTTNNTLWTILKPNGTIVYGPGSASDIVLASTDNSANPVTSIFTSTGDDNLTFDQDGFDKFLTTFNTTGFIIRAATVDGISDTTTFFKSSSSLADKTDITQYVSFITNEAQIVPADSNGHVYNFGNASGEFKVYLGDVDISSHFKLSTALNDQGLKVSYKDQQYTVSGYLDKFEDGSIFLVTQGPNAEKEYYWDSSASTWTVAQGKTKRNQNPLFTLYDNNGVSLSDPGLYPNSNFAGNYIFSYSESTNTSQSIDSYIDIRLDYDQYGEIIFNNNLETDRYTYTLSDTPITGYYYYHNNVTDDYNNCWHLAPAQSSQRLISQFKLTTDTDVFELDYSPTDLSVSVNGIIVSNYTVAGKVVTFSSSIEKNSVVEFKFRTSDQITRTENTSYELPLNLTANPFNEEITTVSKSDYLDHFFSIIKNQDGFSGVASGSNNYRQLDINYGNGTEILQHHNSLTKVMGVGSNDNLNIISAIKFSEREYIRFKNKFVNKITSFMASTTYTSNLDPVVWMNDAIASINLAKNNQFPFYYNVLTDSYIPATPSRLGLYPVFNPEKFIDTTLKEPMFVIQGHDGSIMPAYGDFRDDVILELENWIYNSIPENYKGEEKRFYDIMASVSTPYKSAEYSQAEFNQLLTPVILQWSAKEGIEFEINDTYDETDPFTYNYSNQGLPGYWRGIINLYYGTDRPNTHPWEMFGFSEQPDWWEGRYGPRPYRYNNPFLWEDMRNGVIFAGPRQGTYSEYARVGMPTPVDSEGRLQDPISLGLASASLKSNQVENWEVGDFAPAETVFRKSSHWPFAVAIIGYLMHPAKFFTYGWDLDGIEITYPDSSSPQLISKQTGKRPNVDPLLHSELDFISNGIQTWLIDYVMSNGQSTAEFIDTIRNIDVRIGYKTAGFVNKDTIKLIADNVQTSIPQENINVFLYQNPSVKEVVYSGVVITKVSSGWSVSGYDVLNNYFYSNMIDVNSRKTVENVGQIPLKKYSEFTDTVISVPYGTIFNTVQQVYDFLVGYGEWLSRQGWVLDNFDAGSNLSDTWPKVAKDFALWAQGRWALGAAMSLSPSSTNMKFVTDHGFVENLNQLINGVYSIVDVSGSVVDQTSTFINRNGNEIIIQSDVPIFGVRLIVSEIEHVIILDNKTIFNDLIYSPKLNLYQPRLRLQATRTLDWVGRINAPGYFVKSDTISPNLEKSVADVQKYFDIEQQVDVPLVQEVARRNIGYQSRSYLDQILVSPTTQFQFYQGFIRNKGTISTLSTLLRSGISSGSDNVTFYEEWALKLGSFGDIDNGSNAEFYVDPSELKTNTQLFAFSFARLSASLASTDLVAYVENIENLPDEGIVLINEEKISYSARNLINNSLTGLVRGIDGTTVADHAQFTAFGLDDSKYDSIITLNPTDSRWISKPKILTNNIFNVREPQGRHFNGEYLLNSDNRVAGYVLQSEVFARYNTIYDFTNDLPNLLQQSLLEVNDQIWIDQMPSNDLNFPNQFQVYTVKLKDVLVNKIPVNYSGELAADLTVSDTSISLADAYNWPSSGVITIEGEQIRYNSKSGNTLTDIERGFNGTLIGYMDQDGNLINSGTFSAGTLVNVEFSGYGDQVLLELNYGSNVTPYQAGDTIIFENFFVDYINVSGVYEVLESYDSNIRIDLAVNDTNVVNLEDISVLDLIESHYKYEAGLLNLTDYDLLTFTLANNINSTAQTMTLTSTKNLKAPGVVKIGNEMISYQTINGNNLEGLGRGVNNTNNASHNAGATVTKLKDLHLYFDAANSAKYSTIGTTNKARWYVKAKVNGGSWQVIRRQNLKVDTEEFKNSVIYDNSANYVLAHLQAFDPAKNLFPGQVAAEITYRLDTDPADYLNNTWGVGQVGQIWWDTQNLVYENYEVSNDYYRSLNWGTLTPFSSVDVYEWVESNVLPADWASSGSASDYYKSTNGTPYVDANGNYPYISSEKVNASGQSVTVYYFWVKDLSSNPQFLDREYSVFEIANIIRDPTSEGIVWFAPCSPAGLLVANLNNMALSDETSIQISYNNQKSINDGHTQWLLVREGDEVSMPPESFWSQMKASLCGFNTIYQPVPDTNVDPINRYGNLKRPRQSWFIDQDKATKEFFKSVNRLFALDQIVDRSGFDNLSIQADAPTPYGTDLSSSRPINPCEFSDPLNYSTNETGTPSSFIVANYAERNSLVENGQATIGQQIMVEAGPETNGFWEIWKVVNVTGNPDSWFESKPSCSESFKLTDFWEYSDFSTAEYDSTATITYTFTHYEQILMSELVDGDLVKITDYYADGTNKVAIYKFNGETLDLVFREEGTIQFIVDKFVDSTYGNLNKKITNSHYPNGVPGRQLAINSIIDILRNSLLKNLEVNLIFFSMINQVFSEQLNVDWAFKTTYIVGEGLNQVASQSPVFTFNRSESFIEYIQEAKPYHTKLRDFRINLDIGTELANIVVTDFDKPVWFDSSINDYRVLDPTNEYDMAIMTDPSSHQYWWSQFYDKGTHQVREFETTMYFDRVSCSASFGWDSAGWEEQVWESDVPEYLTAADRIVQSYQELPFDQTDVLNNKVNTNLDLNDLIPGCSFRGTIVNSPHMADLVQQSVGGWSSSASSLWSDSPWSPLAGAANIIDISEYNAIYYGNTRSFKFSKTINGDGATITFNMGGSLSLDDAVVVYLNDQVVDALADVETVLDDTYYYSISGPQITIKIESVVNANKNATHPETIQIGSTARVHVFAPDSFNEPSVEESADIILDGYLFKQPYIDSDHPEELVINSLGESVSFHIQADGIASDGKVMNRIYYGDTYGPFDIGQTAIADDSVLVFLNGLIQPDNGSVYVINPDRKTITFRNTIILTENDKIDIFSFGVGGESIEAKFHINLIVDTTEFTISELATYPNPLVIVDGAYRTDYTLANDTITMNSPILAGSVVDIFVFKSNLYTQFIQKEFTFSGSNIFDLGVVLPSPENSIVSINGLAIASNGDFPDYTINGQNLVIFNKVRGRAASYNNGSFKVNGHTVSGTNVANLISNIDSLSNITCYEDKGQVVIVETNGGAITIVDISNGAGSMGIAAGTYNSFLTTVDKILVYMATNDFAHYDTPTFNNVLTYVIPHDIVVAEQVTVTVDDQVVSYTVDPSNNTVTLGANPGDDKMLQMVIKFINKITFTGIEGGTYDLGFIPFTSEQMFVLLNGLRLQFNSDYTIDKDKITIPDSEDGDEVQVYFYSSRNANGNGSFIVHYDQESNKISQGYKADGMFTLGNNISATDTTLTINGMSGFNYGKLTLYRKQNKSHLPGEPSTINVSENIFVRKALNYNVMTSVSSATLSEPVSIINQIEVVQLLPARDQSGNIIPGQYINGPSLTPLVDYNLSTNKDQILFNGTVTNINIRIRYIIDNKVYNVIRGYDDVNSGYDDQTATYAYNESYEFYAGDSIIRHSGNNAKNRLYRLNAQNTTKLAQPLQWRDREIVLTDAIDLPKQGPKEARMDKPGVVWINGERIEYWRRDGNVLTQIVRGTGGTSAGYAETSNSNYRSQRETYNSTEFTQSIDEFIVNSPLIDYMEVGDIISVNDKLVTVTEVDIGSFKTNTVFDTLTQLTITVFKPRPTVIPSGTAVYNISFAHEYDRGYQWIASPFGMQFNTVDQMARFINFEYNK